MKTTKRVSALLLGTFITASCLGVSTTLTVTEDTYIQEGSSTTNYGTSTKLLTKDGGGSYHRDTLLKFDLSGITYEQIGNAKLMFYLTDNQSTNTSRTIDAYFIASTWDETTVNWSSAPAKGDKAGSLYDTNAGTLGWKELDLTDYISANWATLKTAGTISLRVEQNNGGLAKNYILASKENTDGGTAGDWAPQLVVEEATSPIALKDSFHTTSGTVTGNVKTNDFIPNTANAMMFDRPLGHDGDFRLNTDGSFTYTASTDYPYGVDSFSYYLDDNGDKSSLVTVTIDIDTGGLFGHWELNGDLEDSTPKKGTATLSGNANWYIPIDNPTALEFNGSTYITMENPDKNIYAFAVKFYTESEINSSSSKATLIRYGSNTQQHVIGFGPMTGYLSNETITIVTDGTRRTGINDTISAGWHDLVINWNGTTYDIYLDGNLATMIHNGGGAQLISSNALALGYSDGSTYGYFNGKIDEFRVYSRSMTTDEVADAFAPVVTPVIGLESSFENGILSWTTESEVGVEKYQIIDSENSELITEVAAGESSYSVVIPAGKQPIIVAVDHRGYQQSFPVNSKEEVIISLKSGWNLISSPYSTDASLLGEVVWGWNNETQAYESLTEVTPLQGAWVYSQGTETLTLSGEITKTEWNLLSGWNLVGPAQNMKKPEELTIFGWDRGYQQSGILSVGQGYWVRGE